jgi:hypothetical protein
VVQDYNGVDRIRDSREKGLGEPRRQRAREAFGKGLGKTRRQRAGEDSVPKGHPEIQSEVFLSKIN